VNFLDYDLINTQGTGLSYIVTGFLNKETSSDTEINPIFVEDADDLAGPNAAYEPTKDNNSVNDNQFDIEDSKRQNEISLDGHISARVLTGTWAEGEASDVQVRIRVVGSWKASLLSNITRINI